MALESTGNAQNFLRPHMISKDADPIGVPGSDGNHVSESPSEIPYVGGLLISELLQTLQLVTFRGVLEQAMTVPS